MLGPLLIWLAPRGVVPEKGACGPTRPINLPIVQPWWTELAKEGGYEHITLEEADVARWGLEERLSRP